MPNAPIPAAELCVVLPAHNEAAHLPALLWGLLLFAERIIVVDDGSGDGTGAAAQAAGAAVVWHARRRGKTAAVRSVLTEAASSEWILFMDADGQHDPVEAAALWNARDKGDAVLGVRDLFSP